jgi:hypothetical protein
MTSLVRGVFSTEDVNRAVAPLTLQDAEKLPKGVILSEAKNLSSIKMRRKREILSGRAGIFDRAKPALRMTSTLFPQNYSVRGAACPPQAGAFKRRETVESYEKMALAMVGLLAPEETLLAFSSARPETFPLTADKNVRGASA